MPEVGTARPSPFAFPLHATALLLIDMQRDFLEPGGFGAALGNDVSLLRPAVAPARALLEGARAAGLSVVHTRECHKPDLSDCPPNKRGRGPPGLRIGDLGPMGRLLVDGEPGADIIAELRPAPLDLVVAKPGKGAFHASSLGPLLHVRGITHLLIAGVTTEVCVQTTMREANDRGFECLLVEDATASYVPQFRQSVLEMVRAQGGIVGWTAGSGEALAALAG